MVRVRLSHIHRVRKRLANGTVTEYHYAWRGGPKIWDKKAPFKVGSVDYVEAYRRAHDIRQDVKGTFQSVIDEFLASQEFLRLGERTRTDHRKNLIAANGIEKEFGKAPISAFDHPRIRVEVLRWRDKFSAGTGDSMMATLQRVVSFAYQRGLIGHHHLLKIQKRSKSNRAAIIWRQEEIDRFLQHAPVYAGRVLIAAAETGLRPGDLRELTRSDLEQTSAGQTRIILRTRKSNRRNYASIPVTPRLKAMIDALPAAQHHILVRADGKPFGTANALGALVHEWRDRIGLRKELHFYDCRGTAVTRLVRAGCNMGELAGHMGWSLEYAAQMLSRYAAIDPDVTDGILDKVLSAELRRAALVAPVRDEGGE